MSDKTKTETNREITQLGRQFLLTGDKTALMKIQFGLANRVEEMVNLPPRDRKDGKLTRPRP